MRERILAAAGVLCAFGCASDDALPGESAPPPREAEGAAPAAEAPGWESPGPPSLVGPRSGTILGAWGGRTDLGGDAPAGRNRSAGASVEWREVREPEGGDGLESRGYLGEVEFGRDRSADDPDDRGSRGLFVAGWFTKGRILGPRIDGKGDYRGCDFRYDALVGVRYMGLQEKDLDDTGGFLEDEVDSAHAVEFAMGVRAEYSPVRGLVLFGRADAGVMPLLVYNEASLHLLAGVRLEPVRGVGVEAGWRSVRAGTAALFKSSVQLDWSGPWVGAVVEF